MFCKTCGPVDLTPDQSLDEGTVRLKWLRRICETFGVLPSSLILADILDGRGLTPFATGGFSRVYRTTFNGRPVAVKSLVGRGHHRWGGNPSKDTQSVSLSL